MIKSLQFRSKEVLGGIIHFGKSLLLVDNAMPHGICNSHFGNEVCNGAISIAQWGFMSDWPTGKHSGIVNGFVDHFGQCSRSLVMLRI